MIMIFQSKLDRAMKWLKNKNKKSDSSNELNDENQQDYQLDKTDILAIIISALLVFAPIIIILFIIAYFLSQIK